MNLPVEFQRESSPRAKHRIVLFSAYLLAAISVYLFSPLMVYAAASAVGVDRGIDNRFADFLDAFYEPAQRLTEISEMYDRYILWCLDLTGQQ